MITALVGDRMSWLTTLQWSVLVFWSWTALGVIRATSDEFVLDQNSEACRNLTVHEWKQFTECAANTYSVGDTLNLTCTYTVPTNSPTIPDEDIVWFKDGRSLNVTGSHYNSQNRLLLADSGNYSCRHEDRELVSLPVLVGEKPSNVPVATCRCRSRKRFNCSWHGTTDYRLPTIHQMKLTYKHDNLEYKTCTFETKTRTHVFDMGSLTKGYTGVVTTTNCLGHSHSNYFDADPHKPPCELTSLPPRNVKVAALNSSISLVNVTFDLPEEWTARELISTDKFIFWFTQSMIASADWDDRNRKVVKQQEVSRSKGGNETGMFYSLSVSDEAYSMVCVRVALKTVGESEFSEAGCRRTRMARPSSGPKNFTFINSTQDSQDPQRRNVLLSWDPLAPKEANGIITGYRLTVWRTSNSTNLWEYHIPPNDTTTLVKGILSYQEYKAQLFAINAFGESDPSNVTITKVVTPNKAPLIIICTLVVLTIICCIMLTICLYSKIKKRVLPKVPEPVYYNDPFMTQLQCTHSIEPEVFDPLNSPPVETSTQIANGDAVTLEPAVRVWSEANSTGYSYRRFESSNGSSIHHGSQELTGLQAVGTHDIQHNTYTSLPSRCDDLTGTATYTSNTDGNTIRVTTPQLSTNEEYQSDTTEDYARVALLADHPDGASASGGQEYDVFAARKLEDFPSGEMYDNGPIDRGRSSRQKGGNGLDEAATSESFPTLGFVDPTAAQSSQARWKAAGGANVSNDLGIVSPDRTHREPYLPNIIDTDCVEPLLVSGFHDPYISNQRSLVQDSKGSPSGSDLYLMKAGSTPGSDSNRTCDPYVSNGNDAPARKPNPERPGDANVCDGSNLRGSKGMMTMASKPYISKEKCIPGSKGENVDRTCHPYNSNGRDSTGWKPSPRSQTDPYVPDRSDSTGGSLDPYLPHMLASDTDPLIPDPKKGKKDTTFDPYISHSASAAGQNSSPSFNVSEETFISDPYVTQASLESKIKNLDVPNELPPNNGQHGSTTHAPAMPANPAIFEDMTEAPVDPYVAHAEAVRGSNDKATTGSKPSPSHRTVDKSDGSTVLQQENDPYTSHASLVAGSEFGNKSVPVLHTRNDPYISHDALSTGSEFGNKPVSVLHPRDDPYISHDALSAGLNKPSTPLQQRNDPYVSHDALLSGSVIKNEPKAHLDQNHDPYISHDALSTGPEIGNKPKTLLHQRNDSTVSHDALSAASDLGHEPKDPLQQRNDPYVSCDVLSAGLEFQSKLKPPLHENDDPYVCHDVLKAGSEFESKPESCLPQKNDPYVSHDALLTGSEFENKRRTPLQPEHDPYVSHDAISAGSGGQTKNQKTPL